MTEIFAENMKKVTTLLLCAAIFKLELTAVTCGHFHASTHSVRSLRNNNRGIVMDRRHANCTPYGEEYYQRVEALCQERYVAAVRQVMEQSYCRNILADDSHYDCGYYLLPCHTPANDRENVPYCTDECSERQLFYVFCTTIGEQYSDLNKECGRHPQYDASVYCGYDNGDFCATKYKSTQSLLKKCSVSSSMGSGEFVCNDNCKNAVETYVAESGCCVDYWKDERDYSDEGIDYYDLPTVSDIFSACDVDIPEECIVDFNPPNEFLDCARDASTINRSSTQLASVFVLVSASIGFIAY